MKLCYTKTDFLESLQKENKDVFLYGAGNIGKLVLRCLIKHGVSVHGFIETNPRIKRYMGYPILSLDEMKDSNNTVVVVSTSSKYHEEIEEKLAEFDSIIAISDKLAVTMERIETRTLQFQTHLVEHCNLKCRGCYHFSSLAKEEYLSLDEFESDVERLGELFDGRLEDMCLLGGEPLLHPQISQFFHAGRKAFPIGTIRVLTNGILLTKMGRDFYKSLLENDVELWVTKYPIDFDYEEAEKLADSYGVKLQYFSSEPLRTLGHQPLDIKGEQDFRQNFHRCYRADDCVDLKHGKLYSCIIPAEIKPFCDYFHASLPVCEDDYVDIYKARTAEEILEHLERPMPFCRFCNRKDAQVFGVRPWGRTNYKIEEWVE